MAARLEDEAHHDRVVSVTDDDGTPYPVRAVLDLIGIGDTFQVSVPGQPKVEIRPTSDGKHITTDPDGNPWNNLRNMPRCP